MRKRPVRMRGIMPVIIDSRRRSRYSEAIDGSGK
jgi:hypothetical protein